MKITEKIVTSVAQPQQTNVMWHNPDTGEFKIFGSKGWDNAGGNPNASSGGYPVVTVENDFNIEAQPNTFYNIKNNHDNEVNINFKDEEFGGEGNKILVFYTDINRAQNPDEYQQMVILILSMGVSVTPNSEHEGFKYKVTINQSYVQASPELVDAQFFISDIPTDNLQDETSSINVLVITSILGEEPITLTLPYIYTINKNIDYIAWHDMPIESDGSISLPIIFTHEIGYDGEKYSYSGFINQDGLLIPSTLYTLVEYTKADTVLFENSDGSTSELVELPITVQYNKDTIMPDEIKEFVFNLRSPANIVLSHPVSWNNDNIPDFTKSGIYTLSILNGVGCYTFT